MPIGNVLDPKLGFVVNADCDEGISYPMLSLLGCALLRFDHGLPLRILVPQQ